MPISHAATDSKASQDRVCGHLVVEPTGDVVYASPAALALLELQSLPQDLEGLFPSLIAEEIRAARAAAFDGHSSRALFQHPSLGSCGLTFLPIRNLDDQLVACWVLLESDGAQREGVSEFVAIRTRLRTLRTIVEAADREHRLCAQHIHNTISPHLLGVAFAFHAVGRRAGLSAELAAEMERLAQMLKAAVQEGRELFPAAKSSTFSGDDLQAALQKLASWHPGSTVEINLAPGAALLGEIGWQIYRIAFEAVANVRRHAASARMSIHLTESPARFLSLRIANDGDGFEIPHRAGGAQGLDLMRWRAESVGGGLWVHTTKSSGATVMCVLPFSP